MVNKYIFEAITMDSFPKSIHIIIFLNMKKYQECRVWRVPFQFFLERVFLMWCMRVMVRG